jgi:hypothetical protein
VRNSPCCCLCCRRTAAVTAATAGALQGLGHCCVGPAGGPVRRRSCTTGYCSAAGGGSRSGSRGCGCGGRGRGS